MKNGKWSVGLIRVKIDTFISVRLQGTLRDDDMYKKAMSRGESVVSHKNNGVPRGAQPE